MKKQIMVRYILILTYIIARLDACSNQKESGINIQSTEYKSDSSEQEQMEICSETEGLGKSKFFEETETEDAEQQIEEICEKARSINFTVNEPQMEVTPEENQMYLKKYLKILKNEMPLYDYDVTGEQVYYQDLWRTGIEFEDLLENKAYREFPYLYYYDDLDGDGKPEFATNQGCLYIFNYELGDDFCRILYQQESRYLEKIIGAGQIWYRDGQHGGLLRDRLITFSEDSKGEIVFDLEEGISDKYHYYQLGTEWGNNVIIDKDAWDELTAPFFDMVENHEIPKLTLEEVFGDLLETRLSGNR